MDNCNIEFIALKSRGSYTDNYLDRLDNIFTYGLDNLLPNRIIDLYNSSPTHASIINKKTEYTTGMDINPTDPLAGMFSAGLEGGDGLVELVRRCAFDYWTYGGFCIQVLWNVSTGKVYTAKHQQFDTVRLANSEGNTNKVSGVSISADWRMRTKYPPTDYNMFDGIDDQPCFLYYSKYTLGDFIYPLPDWWSGAMAVENEAELLLLKNSLLKNNFTPSGVLAYPTRMTPEERSRVIKQIQEGMVGSNNAGRILMVEVEDGRMVTWTPMGVNNLDDAALKELSEQTATNILVAHGIPNPILIGLPVNAGFNSEGELLKVASKEFFTKQILPVQKTILKQISYIYKAAGYDTEFSIEQSFNFFE